MPLQVPESQGGLVGADREGILHLLEGLIARGDQGRGAGGIFSPGEEDGNEKVQR